MSSYLLQSLNLHFVLERVLFCMAYMGAKLLASAAAVHRHLLNSVFIEINAAAVPFIVAINADS